MRILLVDDDDDVRAVNTLALQALGFEVVPAASVGEALKQIVSQPFDALVSDLHMPGPGDGFAVITAMRHTQPKALTVLLSGYPDVDQAMGAILLQADEIIAKPFGAAQLGNLIRTRAHQRTPSTPTSKHSVASVMERDTSGTVSRWLARVEKVPELTATRLSPQDRTCHLPEILRNIATRLRIERALEGEALPSPAAIAHGELRFHQGYTAPMIVQESRILQVSIFETIQLNLSAVDFSLVLPDVMLIADEVDSQLAQTIDSYLETQNRNP